MASYKKLPKEVGTSIFVRKNEPGSEVGGGYSVELYEGGSKVDQINKNTLDAVYKFIDTVKDRYNTDRAFKNEFELFVTSPIRDEDNKEKRNMKEKEYAENNEPDNAKESDMDLDKFLFKKADAIHNLLVKITNPDLPLKIRQADMAPAVEAPPAAVEAPPTTANDIATRIFNSLKAEDKNVDIKDEGKFHNDVGSWIRNGLKEALKALRETSNIIITAKTSDSRIAGTTISISDILENLKQMITDGGLSEKLLAALSTSFGGAQPEPTPAPEKPSVSVASKAKEFWKYAATVKGEHEIADVFNDWSINVKISNDSITHVWGQVQSDINNAFNIKTAIHEYDLFNLNIVVGSMVLLDSTYTIYGNDIAAKNPEIAHMHIDTTSNTEYDTVIKNWWPQELTIEDFNNAAKNNNVQSIIDPIIDRYRTSIFIHNSSNKILVYIKTVIMNYPGEVCTVSFTPINSSIAPKKVNYVINDTGNLVPVDDNQAMNFSTKQYK